jgi:hypothetical protein
MAAKPPCTLSDKDPISILHRVFDALRGAGRDDLADEFLTRAVMCQRCRDVAELAREFVEVE